MINNFIKIAIRNISKHKSYSFLNISGLAIGMAATILILLYVFNEKSYDKHHEKSDRIYRVAVKALIGDTKIGQTFTPAILTPTLLENYPEVEKSVRLATYSRGCVVEYENNSFNEPKVVMADAEFFDIFSIPFINGNAKNALTEPNSAVLNEATAKKYFGDQDPLNKIIRIDEYDCKITGIIEEMPQNSHFHFDILISLNSDDGYKSTAWFYNNYKTYVLLANGVDSKTFESKFPELVKNYLWAGKSYKEWEEKGNFWEYYLQPLTEIHLNSDLHGELEANGNADYIFMFTMIAVFIILIASINYMNLSTARLAGRAREVGIRKVVGSTKALLIRQFLAESVFTSFLSLILAIGIVELLLPSFRNLVGLSELEIHYFENPFILIGLIGFALFIGILSGSYPAFYLSSFESISVLSGKGLKGTKNKWLRNGLVLIQFSMSIFLFIGTFIVGQQLEFLQNKNLGYDKEKVVIVKTSKPLGNQSQSFKESLLQNPAISSVSGSNNRPGIGFNNIGFNAEGKDEGITLNIVVTDYEFQNTLKFKMAKGRFYSKDFPTDSSGIVINETAARLLGWEEPLKMHIYTNDTEFHVIGVVKDYHYESLHHSIRPAAILLRGGTFNWDESYISARIVSDDISGTIKNIKETLNEFIPNYPFEYTFLDEEYAVQYKNEQRTSKLFSIFSVLAIFISCLGLFGLASYAAELKTKEIGIRKIMGASIPKLVFMLSKEFTIWVLIANIIAWPIGYFSMSSWLQNYAYRIDIEWTIFFVSGILAIFIALATVSYQAIKSARANPVESLKYE